MTPDYTILFSTVAGAALLLLAVTWLLGAAIVAWAKRLADVDVDDGRAFGGDDDDDA